MADEIGRGVIILSVDGKEVASGIADIKQKLVELESTATKSAGATSAAFSGAGAAVEGASSKMNAATKRWITSIEREIVSLSQSREEFRAWEAQVKKVPEEVYQPLIAKLFLAKQATDDLAAAQKRASSQDAYLQNLVSQAAAIGKTTAQLQRMEAVRLGISAKAEPLIQEGERLRRQEDSKAYLRELQEQSLAIGKQTAELQRLKAARLGISTAAEPFIAAGETARQVQSQQAFIQSLQATSAAIGKTRADLLEMQAIQLGINKSIYGPHIAALRAQEEGLHKVGLSARQTKQALSLLPAQITDIFTSIASGMPLYLVAIQQGGQLKDSFHGIGNAVRAVGGYFTGLIAKITPFIAATGALGAALGIYLALLARAESETKAYNVAIVNSGNSAGNTALSFNLMANRISETIGTHTQATEALVLMAASGRIAGGSIERLGVAAVTMNKATGRAIKETVAEFVELSKAPYEASLKLNEQYNYLTRATLAQIDALVKEGRAMDASTLAMRLYAETVETRGKDILDNLGLFERGWNKVKDAINGVIEAVKSIGRPSTTITQDALSAAERSLADAKKQAITGGGFGRGLPVDVAAQQTLVDSLRAQRDEELLIEVSKNRQAQDQKDAVRNQQKLVELTEKLNDSEQNREKKIKQQITYWKNELGGLWKDEFADQIRKWVDPPKKGKEFKNEADTTMIQEARQRSFVLAQQEQELANEKAIGAEMKKLIEFETLIADLQEKGRLTNSEKELLNGKDAILFFLRVNAEHETRIDLLKDELEIKKLIAAAEQREIDRQEKLTDSVRAYAIAQKEALDAAARGYAEERANFTAGEKERARTAARTQITDRYRGQREQYTNDYITGKINEEQLNVFLGINRGYQEIALRDWEKHYADIEELSKSRLAGATKALNDFVDESTNLAKQSEQVWSKAFNSIGDAIAEFVKTGKLDFKSLVSSFLADIVRLNVNNFFAQFLRTIVGAAAGAGGSAAGQPPSYADGTPGVGMAIGTNYVPYDGFRATLHEGEAIVPKAYNPAAGGTMGSSAPINVYIQAPVEPMSEWRLQQAVREGALTAVRDKQIRGGGM